MKWLLKNLKGRKKPAVDSRSRIDLINDAIEDMKNIYQVIHDRPMSDNQEAELKGLLIQASSTRNPSQ